VNRFGQVKEKALSEEGKPRNPLDDASAKKLHRGAITETFWEEAISERLVEGRIRHLKIIDWGDTTASMILRIARNGY